MSMSKRLPLYIFLIALIAVGPVASAVGQDSRSIQVEVSPDLMVTDSWFFIASKGEDLYFASQQKANLTTVVLGQRFGFAAKVKSSKDKVRLQVRLTVPDSAENFTCKTCAPGTVTFSADHKEVDVDESTELKRGFLAFYWGASAPKDPTGKYTLSFSINGTKIATYEFTVIDGTRRAEISRDLVQIKFNKCQLTLFNSKQLSSRPTRANDSGYKFSCSSTGKVDEGEVLYPCKKDPYDGSPVTEFNMKWQKGYRAPDLITFPQNVHQPYVHCDLSNHSCTSVEQLYSDQNGETAIRNCSGKYL